jgi:esterase FrsA
MVTTTANVDELKRFVLVHAKAQNIPVDHYRAVLSRIHDDVEGSPDSWAARWTDAGDEHRRNGRLLEACRDYAIARFPFVDGASRRQALHRCHETFDLWRADKPIEPLMIHAPGGAFRCWSSGLSTTERKPLLLVMPGIVAIKEQWASVLLQATRLDMAVVVAEMPGVGENPLRYDAASHEIFSAILDTVADRADVAKTYAVALSFSGHLAMLCAVTDQRLRGIVTSGAPVRDFFTDVEWRAQLPAVTVRTLAHLTGTKPASVGEHIAGWGIPDEDLSKLDIPVRCLVSLRDEIIPMSDVRRLRRTVRDFATAEYPDVHGSPGHVTESRLWTLRSILRMRGGHLPQRWLVTALLGATRLRRGLSGARR